MEEEEIVETTTNTENAGTEPAEENQDTQKKEKMFTQDEVNEFVKSRVARERNRITDEYEQKYQNLSNVLNAGLGTNNIEDATKELANYYKEQGVEIPEAPRFTKRQEQLLANAEAEEIIEQGYDYIASETDRLANIGYENLSEMDQIKFTKLAKERTKLEDEKDLKSIGVGSEILEDKDFQEFSSKLDPKLSLKEKYETYEKFKPKEPIETMGSMKNNNSSDNGLKDYYTPEEAKNLTDEDYKKHPKLYEIVEKSMEKWRN